MRGSGDPDLRFRNALISLERLKLETSNLARIRAAVSSNEENAKLGQRASCGGHVTQFWNFGNPLISREGLKLKTSNSARIRAAVSSNEENANLGQNWLCGGHVTQFSNFAPPPNISRTIEARNFKFGTVTDGSEF